MNEESIFIEALDKPTPQGRAAFLDHACGGNVDLRRSVELLLKAHEKAGAFLQSVPRTTATLDDPIIEAPGTIIGPYKVLEQIGEGGFGVVFMAEQTAPVRRKVALKVIKPGMDTRQVIARFEAERQALALMEHPNIARVLDAGTMGMKPEAQAKDVAPFAGASGLDAGAGRPYFVMELVRGTSMTEYCDQHNLPVRERLELFVDVCQAVQHAHQKGIIHRDIKPSNVLVTLHDGKPVVKVIDFGIAKAMGQQLTEKTLFTNFAQMIGTPLYMSPEQAEMSGLDVDTRSDIYSLGVLLYELLTGTTPFDKERLKQAGFDEIRRIIREEEPPKPSTRMSTIGQAASTASEKRQSDPRKLSRLFRGELDWIVMKALEKNRNRRYETASAFAADVGRYLKDESVQACPPTALYRFGKFARRHKTRLAFAGLAFFFLVALGSGIGWAIGDRSSRRTSAATRFDDALAQATAYMQAENWPEAKAAAQRAGGLLAGAGGDDSLHQRLAQVEADLDMVAKLELARLQKAAVKDGHFDGLSADPLYADAFRDYSLPVMELDSDEAARRIAASAIREQLLAALLDWANIQTDPAHFERLAALVRLADDDPWRKQVFFDALDRLDWPRVARLAQLPETLQQPPARLVALGNILARIDLPAAVKFLGQAQQRHPGDFWLNHQLAFYLTTVKPPRPDEAIGFYRAAVALRPRSPGVHLNLGKTLHDKGDLEGAVRCYQGALEIDPNYAQAHNNLGYTLSAMKDLEGAVREYRSALKIDPNFFLPHLNLGAALRRLGNLEEAIRECRTAIRIDPGDARPHVHLGQALLGHRDLNEAIEEFQAAIQLDAKLALAHYSLGQALDQKGDLEGAIRAYQAALRIDPQDAQAHNNLGLALSDKKDLDGAIREYRAALQIDPNLVNAHYNLGIALKNMGDLKGAMREYRAAIEIDPKYADAHNNLGNALSDKKDLDGAIREYRAALEIDPKHANAHNNLGTALADKKDLDGAMREYRAAIEIDPKHANAHNNLGNALSHKKDLDGAIREYRAALQIDPKHANAHNNLGTALYDKNDLEGAIRELRAAIEIDPNLVNAHYNLGIALKNRGDLKGAMREYRAAIEIDPNHANAHNNLGGVLAQNGELDDGIREYRAAIKIDPNFAFAHNNLGIALKQQDDLEGAIREYREAIRIAPDYVQARQNLGRALNEQAWRLATDPDLKSRDPRRALELAKEAVQLLPKETEYWRTLAALSFRAGDGESANDSLKKSIELGNGDNHADHFLQAVAHWHRGEKKVARDWYDRADKWMQQNHPVVAELCRLQAEAATLLGLMQPITGHSFGRHNGSVTCLAFDARGQWLVSGGQDRVVRLWDKATGKQLRIFEGHAREVWSVAISPDSKRIGSAAGVNGRRDQPGELIVWDAHTGNKILTMPGPSGGIFCVSYSPDGKHLAFAGHDGAIKVCDAATGKEERTLRGHTGEVWGLAYRPDGKQIASASFDRTVKVWDADSGNELFTFKGHSKEVWSVAFSPDGKWIASASDDFTVKLWQPGSGKVVTMQGHTTTPYSVAFSPDGELLASASGHRWQPDFPGEVKLWDAATGKPLRTLPRTTSGFFSVAFSPDGKQLAAGGLDHSVTVCDLPVAIRKRDEGQVPATPRTEDGVHKTESGR